MERRGEDADERPAAAPRLDFLSAHAYRLRAGRDPLRPDPSWGGDPPLPPRDRTYLRWLDGFAELTTGLGRGTPVVCGVVRASADTCIVCVDPEGRFDGRRAVELRLGDGPGVRSFTDALRSVRCLLDGVTGGWAVGGTLHGAPVLVEPAWSTGRAGTDDAGSVHAALAGVRGAPRGGLTGYDHYLYGFSQRAVDVLRVYRRSARDASVVGLDVPVVARDAAHRALGDLDALVRGGLPESVTAHATAPDAFCTAAYDLRHWLADPRPARARPEVGR